MGANKYLRRRRGGFLPTLAVAAAAGVGVCSAIEWGETTSSTSDYVLTAAVGEITTVSWCARTSLVCMPVCLFPQQEMLRMSVAFGN